MTLPYTLADGTTTSASQVQANFDYLDARVGALKNANLSSNAAIDKSKLAQPFTLMMLAVQLVDQGGTAIAAGAVDGTKYTINQTTMTSMHRKFRLPLRTGQQAFLCSVEWYVGDIYTNSGAELPRFQLNVDGVQIGGQYVEVDTADAYYPIAATNPIDSPLFPVTNLSVFDPMIGKSAGSPRINNVVMTLLLKVEVVP